MSKKAEKDSRSRKLEKKKARDDVYNKKYIRRCEATLERIQTVVVDDTVDDKSKTGNSGNSGNSGKLV